MKEEELDSGWRQHFPTYAFKSRDIALEEYRTAARILETEERVFLNASSIVALVFAGIGSLALGSLDKLVVQFRSGIPPAATIAMLLLLTLVFSRVALRYFAHRQMAIVFAARKVIVLRRMLGLSYGAIRLVLPNWRIEGADEPFAIRMFPGWNTYVTFPFYMISGISSAVVFLLSSALLRQFWTAPLTDQMPIWQVCLAVTLLWVVLLSYGYRKALLDTHERSFLLLGRSVASLVKLRLVGNFEYVIYRANLARHEFTRLKIDLENLESMLIHIEDRSFRSHRGISIKALLRVVLGLLKIKRRSGGSTITQQLVRTLFIQQPHKLIRRKITEITLALWFDKVFPKDDQLEIYLASVRFERATYGVTSAMLYFFGEIIQNPDPAEAFFLIERVSNIQSRLLADRIEQIVDSAVKNGLLNSADVTRLKHLYVAAVGDGKISDPQGRAGSMLGDPVKRN